MPVVTSVTGLAASGGYYMTAPVDHIYVTPASTVGSVGVRATVPAEGAPTGEIITGPDKGSTATRTEVRQRVEALRRAFVGTVMSERNKSLQLTASELSYAKVYSGARGVELGLADSIGSLDTAIQDAATRADLSGYDVVRMEPPQSSLLGQLGLQADGQTTDAASARATFGYSGVETTRYLTLHGSISSPQTKVSISGSQ